MPRIFINVAYKLAQEDAQDPAAGERVAGKLGAATPTWSKSE
jgi:hypothetical protein